MLSNSHMETRTTTRRQKENGHFRQVFTEATECQKMLNVPGRDKPEYPEGLV